MTALTAQCGTRVCFFENESGKELLTNFQRTCLSNIIKLNKRNKSTLKVYTTFHAFINLR